MNKLIFIVLTNVSLWIKRPALSVREIACGVKNYLYLAHTKSTKNAVQLNAQENILNQKLIHLKYLRR